MAPSWSSSGLGAGEEAEGAEGAKRDGRSMMTTIGRRGSTGRRVQCQVVATSKPASQPAASKRWDRRIGGAAALGARVQALTEGRPSSTTRGLASWGLQNPLKPPAATV